MKPADDPDDSPPRSLEANAIRVAPAAKRALAAGLVALVVGPGCGFVTAMACAKSVEVETAFVVIPVVVGTVTLAPVVYFVRRARREVSASGDALTCGPRVIVAVTLGLVASAASAFLSLFLFLLMGMGAPGRPLRRRGRAILTPAVRGDGWASATATTDSSLDRTTRTALADAWLADARAEHASIGSFGYLALDLLELGAPAELVLGAHRAAGDEVAHARACFDLAARYGAAGLTAGGLELPSRGPVTLSRLAVESLLDGCLNEGFAAAVLEEGAAHANDPRVKDVLTKLALDEHRHAELAWGIVTWALGVGGTTVRTALLTVSVGLGRDAPVAGLAPDVDAAAWRAQGRALPDDEQRIHRAIREATRARLFEDLLAREFPASAERLAS